MTNWHCFRLSPEVSRLELNDKQYYRYSRHILLDEIGEGGQLKLRAAKVLVVGAGGLGCPVLMYLAAAGIGETGIVDFDLVDESNLQRQVLFGESFVGKNKAEAAVKRLTDLNSDCNYKSYPNKLDTQNAIHLFNQYDLIVDCTDNFAARYLINDACYLTGKPFVHGSIFKFQGQVSVFNYNNGPTYRCLFPDPPGAGTVPSCSDIGVLGVLPGIIGSLMASEVLKIVLGLGETLSGEVLICNALKNDYANLKLTRNEKAVNKAPQSAIEFIDMDYEDYCGNVENPLEIEIEEFNESISSGIEVIDVREYGELPEIDDFDYTQIPMSQIQSNFEKIDREKNYIVVCQYGIRSLQVVEYLKNQHGYENLKSLKEGLIEYYQKKGSQA
jgi:adenylyltransferase/sulfurtransferase